MHTTDFTCAIEMLLSSWKDLESNIFNIAGDQNISIKELVEFIYNQCGSDTNLIKYGSDRPFNDQEYNIKDELIRSMGWSPKKVIWDELALLCKQKSFIEKMF